MSILRPALARLAAALALATALFGGGASAHVTELAVLNLNAVGKGQFIVLWELRPNTEYGETLQPVFPDHCRFEDERLDCGETGLVGRLGFEGIGAGQSAAMFKIRGESGEMRVFTLTPADPVAEIGPEYDPSSWAGLAEVFGAYTQIGIEHILLGVDHLLFVLGLMWIARGRWMLFKTITAFTLAHSLTLGAVTFGWVGVPEIFVNAMIALSIVFVGLEILHAQAGRSTYTLRNPWVVAFFFGLLHGFGFANALVQLGLPEGAVPIALVAFNIGVEVGQIGFVLAVLALAWSYRVMTVPWPERARAVPAYAIGGLAAFWFIDRTIVLFGA